MKCLKWASAIVLLGGSLTVQAADPREDQAMTKLASDSGCLTCHGIDAPKSGPGGLPQIGPSWAEVAGQYAGKPGAAEFLTKVVLEGSNPYSSVWQGKISGLAMPPNAVAISETDARSLVYWILAIPPTR